MSLYIYNKNNTKNLTMAKYHVDYMDKSGDLSHVWVEANSVQEAEDAARSEYWDIDEIVQIYKS